jgi:phage terminase small subunit
MLFFYNRESPMPRKSANEIELATIAPAVPWTHERPDPPQGMPEAAAAVWRDAVASMKARHFSKETHALLARYCHAMAECERLETSLTVSASGSRATTDYHSGSTQQPPPRWHTHAH